MTQPNPAPYVVSDRSATGAWYVYRIDSPNRRDAFHDFDLATAVAKLENIKSQRAARSAARQRPLKQVA